MAVAARHLASRSIHIKVYPTTCSFSERREVLRVLERFGEVEMFRSLKHDSTSPVRNAFLSILDTRAAARAAIAASPIRYHLMTDTDAAMSQRTLSQSISTSPNADDEAHFDVSEGHTSASENHAIFELHISPSAHPYHFKIVSSPLYGPFCPISPRLSPIAADLSTRIPDSIAKPGLIDWVTDSATSGMMNQDSKPWRLRQRDKRWRQSQTPLVMKGLVDLRERKESQRMKRERKEGSVD